MSKKSAGFDKVLAEDPIMMEIKGRLEAAKDILVGASCEAITRMRELMAIDSKGEVGEGSADSEGEIPMLVYALSEAMARELAVREMDILMPGWQDKAAEVVTEMLMDDLMKAIRH